MSFQVRKAHLDFLALIARSSKFRGTRKGAGIIAGFFVDVACDLPEWCAGASFLEFANAAVSWVGQIILGSAIMDGSRGPQKPTVRTDIDVARSRQAEIERVKRKRPDSLDAYDLVLRSLPQVFTLMPDGALRALPLLERALALEPDYATALAYAAWCHEVLFVRAGLREENRLSMSRYARAALLHGRDDATALTVAGFCIRSNRA